MTEEPDQLDTSKQVIGVVYEETIENIDDKCHMWTGELTAHLELSAYNHQYFLDNYREILRLTGVISGSLCAMADLVRGRSISDEEIAATHETATVQAYERLMETHKC